MPTLLDFTGFMKREWAVYPMSAFGNDTVGHFVWEKKNPTRDLVLGDGSDTDTFPTFVSNADHETDYYSFDGVDDHFSAWPTMPTEYTVVAALSDSYPDGQPYFQSCNDTTIQALLTTPGTFTGNVHNLVIFDWQLSALELAHAEQRMMRRLWRNTFVDPFTARLVRSGECVLAMYFEEEASALVDYSENEIGNTDYSTVWNSGLTFPVAGAAVAMDSDAALNLDELTIFLEAPNFDLDASAETILANGTNYILSIALSAGVCTVTLNGSDFSFSADGFRTLAIAASSGDIPRFYLNGKYAGYGDSSVTLSSASAGQLTIGNNVARNNPFASTLKKLSIYNVMLSDSEIQAAHVGASAERPFTV